MTVPEEEVLQGEVKRLLDMGAITPVHAPSPRCVIIPTFLLQKEGKDRPIFDYRIVNAFLDVDRFKMETVEAVIESMPRGGWAAKVDLQDAYLHVPLREEDKDFLCVEALGKVYRPNVLLFGLSPGPLVFTKLGRVPITVLRYRGIMIFMYLDDVLIHAPTKKECAEHTSEAIHLLQALGFKIRWAKSQPFPTQVMDFLGWQLDYKAGSVALALHRVVKTKKVLRQFLAASDHTLRELSSVVGLLMSAQKGLKFVRMLARGAQHAMNRELSLETPWDAQMAISAEVREDLKQVLLNLDEWNGISTIPTPTTLQFRTDASGTGWGGNSMHLGDLLRVRGPWEAEEVARHVPSITKSAIAQAIASGCLTKVVHIGILEALAILLTLNALAERMQMQGQQLLLLCDNMSVVYYLNRQGGTRSPAMSVIARAIWELVTSWGSGLVSEHLPREFNVIADEDSKAKYSRNDWKLNPRWFQMLDAEWGPHHVDTFASALNHHLPRYCTWEADSMALAQDAFSISWAGMNVWINPPWVLIGRILNKVIRDGCDATLITPHWPSQPWFPTLLELLCGAPILLPHTEDLFLPGRTMNQTGVGLPQWDRTVAWRLCGDASRRRDIVRQSLTDWPWLVDPPRGSPRTPSGDDGVAGVKRDQWILFDQTYLG